MKYTSLFFPRRKAWFLKALVVSVMTVWYMILLTQGDSKSSPNNIMPVEYHEINAKPLRMGRPMSTKKKSEPYGNKMSEGQGVLAAQGFDNAPGELGKPVVLPKNMSEYAKQAVSEGWKKNAFNQYVSDLISIRRKLPDFRDEWCKEPGRYLKNLPQTSVVVCFHNEAWSVLLRTVHSVIDKSPPHLLKEIILVDDFSDMPHLMQQLDDYMMSFPKIKIVRAKKREGLIRARLLGARFVTAPVLTYLDSHCECTEGWLEPLLDRIARNKTTVVCPDIDAIDDNTLEYQYRGSTSVNVGGFDWNLQFNWHPVPAREKARHEHSAEPVWSPTMAGGLFAIDKEYFEILGTYDSGFDIWGGENLELSFKIWMCGGTLEIVPCSHVGHIFRTRSPYKWPSGVNVLKKNLVRLAEYWMYSNNGEIRRDMTCLDYSGHHVVLYPCHGVKGNQLWVYKPATSHIRHYISKKCMAISRNKEQVIMESCQDEEKRQMWKMENFHPERLKPDLLRNK